MRIWQICATNKLIQKLEFVKEILKYLRNPEFADSNAKNIVFDNDKLNDSYESLTKDLSKQKKLDISENPVSRKPLPKERQVWLCKQSYIDTNEKIITGKIPYYVVIWDGPGKIGKLEFVRVQPISIFTEFKAADDIYVEDEGVTGFKFIIETWNEQPIDVTLLDSYIGSIELEHTTQETKVILTDDQKEFRKLEIENTAYLRQSVNSFLSSEEKEKNRIPFYFVAVAAALVILFLIWQPQKSSNETIFIAYANPEKAYFDYGTSASRATRGIKPQDYVLIAKSLGYFNSKEYSKAAENLNDIFNKTKDEEVQYYLAISLLKSGNIDDAIVLLMNLNKLIDQNQDIKFTEEVPYFLSLAYIRNGEKGEAKELLNKLILSNNKYTDEAKEILKQIRWF